jgi:hypothetical protein
MRLRRSLALAALAAGLTVLAGDLGSADDTPAKVAKQDKKAKNKKAKAALEALKAAKAAREAEAAREADAAKAAETPRPADLAKPSAPAATKDPAALARLIDAHIDRRLAEAKVSPAPPASDDEFLRRAYLDLTGVIPPADKARAFLDSTDPDKRARLIDELLDSPNYGKHLADLWQARLFPRDSANRFVLREPLVNWLEEQFNANTPWDRFAYELVTATGTVEANPAVTFFLANRAVDKLTDSVSQNFLGVQLQCAQCHNHPFTRWKQTEYWGMAAFFSKVQPQNPKNPKKGPDNSQLGVREGPARTKLKDFFPESTKNVPPKFLGGPEPKLSPAEPYRPALAKWMTAPDNPFFARAIVNRTWGQLFGRGFVHPVDDMCDENPPSHPELLDELAREFVASGFDLKNLYRAVCNTRAYQRTSKPAPGGDSPAALFARMAVKVMTPEQLFDSLAQVTGAAGGPAGRPGNGPLAKGLLAKGPRGGPAGRDGFVQFFLAGADAANTTEYEAGIPQALRLMNSRVTGNPALVRAFAAPGDRPAAVIEKLYLAALARRPTEAELARLTRYVAQARNPAEAYGDVLWAVLNSSEFTMVK